MGIIITPKPTVLRNHSGEVWEFMPISGARWSWNDRESRYVTMLRRTIPTAQAGITRTLAKWTGLREAPTHARPAYSFNFKIVSECFGNV